MNSWQDTLNLCEELEALLRKHGPSPNDEALRQCLAVCSQLRSPAAYINNSLNSLESRLPIYFSARRHANHAGGLTGLKVKLASDISGIRQHAIAEKMREENKRDA